MLTVRFYAELNDHLPAPAGFREIALAGLDGQAVGPFLDRLGIPLEEVDLILVNGEPVSLDHLLGAGDRVSVYPVFESFDISALQRLRPEPLRVPRFVLDVHLGRLCTLLRMLGIDARYKSHCPDAELKAISRDEQRALLSRDRALIESRDLDRAYRIRHQNPDDQLREVMERFQLAGCIDPFTRCLRCNTILQRTPARAVEAQLPPRVRDLYHEFWRCPTCGRVYWRGSHYERMRVKVLHLIGKT